MAETVLNCLLLRGMIREQRHWGRFPETLSKHIPELSLHFLDHVGIGTEERRSPPFSVREMADDLRARWLELKKEHPGPWVGFSLSLGSMVLLDWASRFEEDFEKIAVMNTSAANICAPWKRINLGNVWNMLRMAATKSEVQKERIILSMNTSMLGEAEKESYAAEWGAFQLPVARMRRLAGAHFVAAGRFTLPKKAKIPITVFLGKKDKLVNPDCTMALAKSYGLATIEHPDAGHDLCLDAPDWVASELRREWFST